MSWRVRSSPPIILSEDSLQSFAVVGFAVAVPGGDASRENALNGPVVEGPEDARASWRTTPVSRRLLCLLQSFVRVKHAMRLSHTNRP